MEAGRVRVGKDHESGGGGRGAVQLVSRLGSSRESFPGASPATFSLPEEVNACLQVYPGSLKAGQLAGPIWVHRTARLVACRGEEFLVSETVDCQPLGTECSNPMDLDFGVSVGMEGLRYTAEADPAGGDGAEERARLARHLLDTHKVGRRRRRDAR